MPFGICALIFQERAANRFPVERSGGMTMTLHPVFNSSSVSYLHPHPNSRMNPFADFCSMMESIYRARGLYPCDKCIETLGSMPLFGTFYPLFQILTFNASNTCGIEIPSAYSGSLLPAICNAAAL